jgi:hypothetical protein
VRLLLDEHLPRDAAEALRRKFPALDAVSIYDTSWRGLPDPPLLETLDHEGWTLVSRDVNTIPEFVKARLAAGLTHGGVIYADSKRLRQSDVRGLIRRLIAFVEKHGAEDWTCREGWL